jgi:xanthine dehydrogenase accessory factor
MSTASDILDLIGQMKAKGQPFALATVVRTVAVTAAKAGAKAVIAADGTISGGWIGGGCARAAVVKAAREALADGKPRLVSVQPPNQLEDQGVRPGESRDGIRFARNMCPSQGTMDVFVEPVLPRPALVVYGSSPVAIALARMAGQIGYEIVVCAPADEQKAIELADSRIEGFALPVEADGHRFIVISTQGKGDEAAVKAALSVEADYKAFVGSRRKMQSIRAALIADGCAAERIDAIKAPAGLDIGSITPEEIALSILAEITRVRRAGQRD